MDFDELFKRYHNLRTRVIGIIYSLDDLFNKYIDGYVTDKELMNYISRLEKIIQQSKVIK